MFRRLVENLAALDPTAVHRPVPVIEIADQLVPYRTHRALLGVDTHEDYEMTVLRLLAGDGGFVQVFPEDVAAMLVQEAGSVNPDTGIFRQFTDATFLLDADRVAELTGDAPAWETGDRRPETAPEAPVRAARPVEPPVPAGDDAASDEVEQLPFSMDEDDADAVPSASRPREINVHAACSYCGGDLPVGRSVLFCPHCGQNIGVVHCPTCGSELDVGWTFCITCGQKVTGIG